MRRRDSIIKSCLEVKGTNLVRVISEDADILNRQHGEWNEVQWRLSVMEFLQANRGRLSDLARRFYGVRDKPFF